MRMKIYPTKTSSSCEDGISTKKYFFEKRDIAHSSLKFIFFMCSICVMALLIAMALRHSLFFHQGTPDQMMSQSRVMLYSWFTYYAGRREMLSYNLPTPAISDLVQPIDKVISCYYNTPREYRSSELLPSNINPHLCTHINIAFAQIVNKKIVLDENQKRATEEIIELKRINPNLKILLSIGGSSTENGFSDMVIDHASRKVFIKSIKEVLRNYTLDGIDLDWEFPAIHSFQTSKNEFKKSNRERQHFSQLLREIRTEYNREKRQYLLTVAVPAPEFITVISYDVDQLNLYTDYVNIMTYDFHSYTKLTPFTGLNSPLYRSENTTLYMSTLNINYTVHMYMRKGLQANKIVVGIPTYGHSFHLVNPINGEIGCPANYFGSLGGSGFVDYRDICKFIEENKFDVIIRKDNVTKVPYLHRFYEWVSYDDPESVMYKANYIKDNRLRGAMIYSLNSDDYQGVCQTGGTEKFPLSHSIKNTLINSSPRL